MLYHRGNKWKVSTKDMKPRIFISSTFYDLKSIREELYHFIHQYNYEPIESETGDIGYVPGEDLDKSCYKAMKDCDMAILIIGGRYGSPASDEIDENGDYISVTQKEFRTAVNSGIPVYAFIEQAVSVEYDLYKLNRERFNDPEFKFEFSSVDSINVFKFIAELKSISGIPTVSFAKSQDIKDYLATQWADLFKKYLESLRRNTSNKKMTDSVEQMKILMDKMDVMLDTVGKKILTADNSNEYESVLEKQKVLAFCAELVNSLEILETDFVQDEKERRLYVERLLAVLKESVETDIWDIYRNMDTYVEFYNYFDERKIDLNWSDEKFDDTIRKNINIFNKENLKQILIDEIMREKNYKKLFSEMKK